MNTNKIVRIISIFLFIRNDLSIKIPIKFVRSIINTINRVRAELKIMNILRGHDIERIMYDFAEIVHIFGLESEDLVKLKKLSKDEDEYGIVYTVFTNNRTDRVSGINMKIWTKDKMAILNLKLLIEFGNFNLNITWAYKNENGRYVNYNRTEDILVARDEIKSILIEYVSKQIFNLMSIT